MTNLMKNEEQLVSDIRGLIEQSKDKVAREINRQMTMLYWYIGKRIRDDVIGNERAEYGEQIVKNLAKTLTSEYGKGFSRSSILKMIQFYDFLTDEQIVSTVSGQLSWSHIIELLPLKTKVEQEFYAYMTIESNWSVRQLRYNIHVMTYDRTIASQKAKKPLEMPAINIDYKKELMQPDILLKDPYLLDFLGLKDNFYECRL